MHLQDERLAIRPHRGGTVFDLKLKDERPVSASLGSLEEKHSFLIRGDPFCGTDSRAGKSSLATLKHKRRDVLKAGRRRHVLRGKTEDRTQRRKELVVHVVTARVRKKDRRQFFFHSRSFIC